MQIKQAKITCAGAPALALFHGTPEERARQGTILFYHGLGFSKESNLPELTTFADRGFLALGIDAVAHGERRSLEFEQRLAAASEEDFFTVVRETAGEVPAIIDDLMQKGWIYRQRIGIAGISLGGFIVYAAIVADKRIQVAASLLGSPEWKGSLPGSPHLHLDSFFPVALLSLVAQEDARVPPGPTKTLHHQLLARYSNAPERLSYIEYPQVGHDLSAPLWEQSWHTITRWFETFLAYTLT